MPGAFDAIVKYFYDLLPKLLTASRVEPYNKPILGLPPEIWIIIMSHLDMTSICMLALTCKALNQVANTREYYPLPLRNSPVLKKLGASSATSDPIDDATRTLQAVLYPSLPALLGTLPKYPINSSETSDNSVAHALLLWLDQRKGFFIFSGGAEQFSLKAYYAFLDGFFPKQLGYCNDYTGLSLQVQALQLIKDMLARYLYPNQRFKEAMSHLSPADFAKKVLNLTGLIPFAEEVMTREMLRALRLHRVIPVLHITNAGELNDAFKSCTSYGIPIPLLPNITWQIAGIKILEIANPHFIYLSPQIGSLTELIYLSLSGCSLPYLPDEIGHLLQLEELDLSGNPLIELPDGFLKLTKLAALELEGVRLSRLPENWNSPHNKLAPSIKKIVLWSHLRFLFDDDENLGSIMADLRDNWDEMDTNELIGLVQRGVWDDSRVSFGVAF